MSGILFRKFLLGLLCLSILASAAVHESMEGDSRYGDTETCSHDVPKPLRNSTYSFSDPELAYAALSQLEVINPNDPNNGYKTGVIDTAPHMDIKPDNQYCDKRRAYFVENPDSVFQEMSFLSDMHDYALVRKKILSVIGKDEQPHIGFHSHQTGKEINEISPAISNFFTRKSLFRGMNISQQYSCLSQCSNQIPGKQAFDIKYVLSEAVANYAQKFEGKPQCFDFGRFFPKTYLLYRKDECQTFFSKLNSPEYAVQKAEKKIVYVRKLGRGAHMGEGVFLVNDEDKNDMNKLYDEGRKCGEITEKWLVQDYIQRPLLINNRKFDFRSYILIASTNPLMVYYHDGSLRVSLMEYDPSADDKKTLMTNIRLNHEIYDQAKQGILYNGMNETELRNAQQWSPRRFRQYMMDTGIAKDPAWFDEYLRPQFKKAMIHLARFGLVSPYVDSTVYQHYGLDFMLDEDLNLWFLEANSAPGMDKLSDEVEEFLLKMLTDEMEIVMGLLRSRMKRTIVYVNELIKDGSVTRDAEGKVVVKNLEEKRQKFKELTENYFEDEFQPSADNGFSKIIDGRYKGAAKYMGFLGEECV